MSSGTMVIVDVFVRVTIANLLVVETESKHRDHSISWTLCPNLLFVRIFCVQLCHFYFLHVRDSLFIISTFILLYTAIDLQNKANSVKYVEKKMCAKKSANQIPQNDPITQTNREKKKQIQCEKTSNRSSTQVLVWIKSYWHRHIFPSIMCAELLSISWEREREKRKMLTKQKNVIIVRIKGSNYNRNWSYANALTIRNTAYTNRTTSPNNGNKCIHRYRT